MDAAPLITVDRLTIRFGAHSVLRDLSLRINSGETLAVIGESGCGKTVLLKALMALVRPAEGEIRFDGRRLDQLSAPELTKQRLRFGFVFQGAALFDSMDILENVAFALREHRQIPDAEVRATVRDLLHEVGLSADVVHKKPVELSGGMRKRVGFARAVTLDPEVMLYDEPTTGLDPIMSDVINELILKMRRRRPVTSVIVSHDMKSVMKVADRVVMLYPLHRLKQGEGQIVFDGPPASLDASDDSRVTQFVRGEAGDRLTEIDSTGVDEP